MNSRVSFPDENAVSYSYNNKGDLTGVYYNGRRYSTFKYGGDYDEYAVESSHHGGIDKYTFDYSTSNGKIKQVAITNPLNRKTIYKIDSGHASLVEGLPTSNCLASRSTYSYDENGYLERKINAEGIETKYRYSRENGKVEHKIEAKGTSVEYRTDYKWYDDSGLIKEVKTPNYIRTFSYNDKNEIEKETYRTTGSDGLPIKSYEINNAFTFHSNGHIKQFKSVNDTGSTAVQDYNFNGQIIKSTDQHGAIHLYNNYNANGRLTKETLPSGLVKSYIYTPRGDVESITETASGINRTTRYKYNEKRKIIKETLPDGTYNTYIYDRAYRLTEKRYSGDGSSEKYTLDDMGNTLEIRYFKDGLAPYRTITYTYDELGQMLSQKEGFNTKRYQYDKIGRMTGIRKKYSESYSLTYDERNRPVNSIDAHNIPITYSYDDLGLDYIKGDYSQVTDFTLDGFGNEIEQTSPDRGKLSYQYYSPSQKLKSVTNGKGTIHYTYNDIPKGERITKSFPEGTEVYHLNYKGLPTYFSDKSGNTNLAYNSLEQLTQMTKVVNGGNRNASYVVKWKYDSLGRLVNLIYPNGNLITYNYRSAGISSVEATINGKTIPLVSNISMLPAQGLSSLTYGNGLTLHNDYDDGVLRRINIPNVQDLQYYWSPGMEIERILNRFGNNWGFSYNDGRLSAYGVYGQSPIRIIYGDAGNPEYFQQDGHTIDYREHTWPGNQIELRSTSDGSSEYLYDDNGNLVQENFNGSKRYVYNYDTQNRMSSFNNKIRYTYDAFNNRNIKQVESVETHYVYAPGSATLLTENGNINYVYLFGSPIALIKNNQVYYIHNDHLGRPEVITNKNKLIVWRANLEPFNRTVAYSSIGDFNLGFPGQYFDSESGLWYNINRYYDPETGRYTQSDPIGLAGGVNTYAYVGGNPVMKVDPLGLDAWSTMRDYTGGCSSSSFTDDVVDNYVEVMDSTGGKAAKIAASFAVAKMGIDARMGNSTVGQAAKGMYSDYKNGYKIEGMGSRSFVDGGLHLIGSAIKKSGLVTGTYSFGVLIGSAIRTGANRLGNAMTNERCGCSK